MPTFLPSAKVKLALRFEEFSDKTKNPDGPKKNLTPPKKAAKNLKGIALQRTELKVETRQNQVTGQIEYFIAGPNTRGAGQKTPLSPNEVVTNSDPFSFGILGIIPKKATLGINGVHDPDTLSLTLDWKDFPIDPRTIRACGVQFYMGTVTADDYARGMRGETRAVKGGGGSGGNELRSIVPDNYVIGGKTYSNLRFSGWVDKFQMERDGESPGVITLECTDNSRLLIDQKVPQNLRFNPKLPIAQAIAEFLANGFPQLEGMTVQYFPASEEASVTYSKAQVKGTHPVDLGPAPDGGEDVTLLDYLTGICQQLGHNFYVDGTFITITRTTSLIGNTKVPRPDDPYKAREINGRFYNNRTFIWGVNLKKLEYKREFAGKGPKNYEVRSYNTLTKNMTVARYPEKGDRVIGVLPNGGADEKWNEITVGVNFTQDHLKEIARQVYEQMSRTELGVSVSTRDLASYGGSNLDPDLLAIKTADVVDIYLDQTEGTGTYAEVDAAQVSAQTATAYLLRLGYTQEFANAYGKSRSNVYLTHTYYMRTASMEWDKDSGISIDLDLVNYLEIRLDASRGKNVAVNPNTNPNKTTSQQKPQ